jgi:hypothetical protein
MILLHEAFGLTPRYQPACLKEDSWQTQLFLALLSPLRSLFL